MNAFAVSGLLYTFASLAIGGFVFWKCADRPLGRTWLVGNIAVAVWGINCLCTAFTRSPQTALWVWRATWGFGVVWIPSVHFHLVTRMFHIERRRFVQLNYGVAAVFFSLWWTPLIYRDVHWMFNSFFYGVAGPLYPLFLLWWGALTVYIHVLLGKAWQHALPQEKNRILYYALSTTIGYGGPSLCFVPVFGPALYPWGNFSGPLYPLLMGYTILRHRLLDITVFVRKTLIYSAVTALLTAIYVGLLALILHLLERWGRLSGFYAPAAAAAVIALCFHPLASRIQRWVDRHFPRERLDPGLLREAAGSFAHEMKRPLAKISLPAQVILRDLNEVHRGARQFEDVYPQVAERLKLIIDQAMDAGSLIEAIRELAAPNATPPEALDLKACVEDAIRTEAASLEKNEVTVQIDWPETIPRAQGWPKRIRIVLLNLIRNAVDAMVAAPGQKARRIQIAAVPSREWVEMTVTDNGPGLPDVVLEHLFQPHFTTKGEHGTGLGLYLSSQLAESCQGRLTAGNVAGGGGAQFRLRLPIATKGHQ